MSVSCHLDDVYKSLRLVFCANLPSKASIVHLVIIQIARERDMSEYDVGGGGRDQSRGKIDAFHLV